MLLTRDEETGLHLQRVRAGRGAVAAEDFAIDDDWTNGLLGHPVGGFQVRVVQKSQHLRRMLRQKLGQPPSLPGLRRRSVASTYITQDNSHNRCYIKGGRVITPVPGL